MPLLGDLVEIKGGGTPRKSVEEYWGGDIPWASVKDFRTIELSKTTDSITKLGVENSATRVVPAGTIIVPTRMALGKVAVAAMPVAINQDLKALLIRDESRIYSRYLLRCIEAKGKEIEKKGKGATVKGISIDVLKELYVPLPEMSEQKRIATILDKADALRRKRQQAIELADQFLRSVFMEMFGDPVSNPKGWPKGKIRDLVSEAKYGTSQKAHTEHRGVPVLRMGNITYEGGWDFSDLKYVELVDKECQKHLLKKGDLLFNRTNSKELVGKTAVFEEEKDMVAAGYLVRIRTNDLGNPYYISGYLNSKHGKQTLFSMCKSIVGMANINAQEVQDIDILIPPKSVQDRFEFLSKQMRVRTEKFSEALRETEHLFASLSSRAFSGNL